MTETMELWNKFKKPPVSALKKIKGGRLSGMTDISPMWRYQVMTEQFGPIGIGWYYDIDRVWNEPGADNQVFAFAKVLLFIKDEKTGKWSAPINGIGGSMLVTKEKSGLHSSDEGYKMAVTDALSVAMKMLGVGADIYMGKFDGSKYAAEPVEKKPYVKPELTPEDTEKWGRAIKSYQTLGNLDTVKKHVRISAENEALIIKDANEEL